MTTKNTKQSNPEAETRLLSSEESGILSQIASMEEPHNSRAQALLAVNEGTSQAQAGLQAGLTKGQVRYWLGKFRKERMSIFPEELLNQAQTEDVSPKISTVVPDLEQVANEDEIQQPAAQQKAAPKAKKKAKKRSKKKPKKAKAKKSKKKKKPKRNKKAKKGKKSSKKTKKKRSKKRKGAKGKSSKKRKKKSKK